MTDKMLEKYEAMTKNIARVKRAILDGIKTGDGKFESGKNIYYVTCLAGDLRLFRADQRAGSVRLYTCEDIDRFFDVCFAYILNDRDEVC